MQVCADRDIQIYKVYLAVLRIAPGEEPTAGRLPVFLPTKEHPPDKIRINLVLEDGRRLVFVNGRCVGPVPDALEKVRRKLEGLYRGPDTMVQIEPRSGIQHKYVVAIVDQCRRAKISRIAFSPIED